MKSFYFLLFLIFTYVISVPAFALEIPLDVHVHYAPIEFYKESRIKNGADKFLEQKVVQKSFLISPSFHIMNIKNEYTSGSQSWRRNLKFRSKLDEATSELVSKNPDRFYGLCGYNATWKDGIKIVTRCLDKKGMIGIKIHTGYTETASDDRGYKRIIKMFKAVEKKRPVVLWHLHHDAIMLSGGIYLSQFTKRQVEKLFEVINAYPKITFIMAHSLYNPAAISYLVQLEKMTKKANNLYIEISTNWDKYVGTRSLYENYISSWREFGFERVLYGSDLGFPNFEIKDHLETIMLSNMLTQQEKETLLIDNGRRFVDLLRKI